MKYLVTGGCGFLGSNIVSALLREGHTVAVLDNLSRTGCERNLQWLRTHGEFKFVQGDVRDAKVCETSIAQFTPDVIFHLAGQVAMTTSLRNPRADFEANAMGSLNVLEAVRARCPQAAVIYSSTNKVYGDLERLRIDESKTRYRLLDYTAGLPETIGLDFQSPYGCSKGCADQYMLDFARVYGLKTAVFRHSSIYGGRQYPSVDQGWIGWFCEQAIRQAGGDQAEFTISGSGKQVRDVLHGDDATALYLAAACRINGIAGHAFNIGGGMDNSLSILELMSMLEANLNTKLHWRHIAPRESDQKVFVADTRKAHLMLGWTPRVNKEEGIRSMLDWVRSADSEMPGL